MTARMTLLVGDCIEQMRTLPDASINCCVTSPPYFGLRDYQVAGQIGLEATPDAFVARLVEVFREVRRVLRDDGTLFLNLGDSYQASGLRHTGRNDTNRETPGGKGGSFRGGVRRAIECDTSGKEGSGSRGRGLSSGSPDGGRTDAWWTRIPGSDAHRALAQAGEPLSQIRESMASLAAHLPIAGSSLPTLTQQSAAAILGQAQRALLAVEQLRASLESMPIGYAPPPPAGLRLSDMLSACLSSLRSFADDVRHLSRRLAEIEEMPDCTGDIASLCAALERRIQCSSGYCSILLSWLDIKPERDEPQLLKPKDLIGIPWRVAFALQADGWYLRQDIIWSKPNPMPESVRDRCTKAHEYVFLLSKGPRYYFDSEAIKEPGVIPAGTKGAKGSAERAAQKGVNSRPPEYKVYDGMRNRRSVWTVPTRGYAGAHFATFPPDLIEPCILAGCPAGGTVLDPFGGSGTTAGVAIKHGRNAVLCELNPDYAALVPDRVRSIAGDQVPLFPVAAE